MNSTTSSVISPYNKPSHSRTIYSDRFVPSRTCSNFSLFNRSTPKSDYATRIHTALFGPESPSVSPDKSVTGGKNIFKYKSETRQALHSLLDDHLHGVVQSPVTPLRKFPKVPYKVMDAPGLEDDFYSNLLDWSSMNILAVGLGNCVYIKNVCTSKVTKLCDLGENDSICSVGWAPCGTNLAVGTSRGKVQVCALKWSYNDRELASGGDDNRLYVWNQHSIQPVLKYCEHTAAVKAIEWSPHLNGLLASGGGTTDKCIRFWNTTTNSHLSCINTGSQVCNLVWSKNVNELVSTHGYSQNQILVWRYPEMSKLATLRGHTERVLHLAISPDGKTIVTGAGDETLRFWNVFPSSRSQNTQNKFGVSVSGRTQIR